MGDIETFRLFLLREGNQPSTVHEKLRLIKKLLNFNPSLTLEGINTFIGKMIEQERIKSYINFLIITVRQWGICFNRSELAKFPLIKGNNSTFVKSTLSDEEIEALLNLPYYGSKNGFYVKRHNMWTVFFTILAYTGARPSEVAQLTINDVDFGNNTFIFHKTKTHIPRQVPISFVIQNKVKEYIKSITGKYLFPNYQKKRTPYVDAFSWRYPFDERIKRLGIKRDNLTVYSLRHSFITRQVDEDVSVFKIQQLVGHKQLETTAKYVHLSYKALRTTIENDRLAKKYRSGSEILEDIIMFISKIEKQYKNQIRVSIKKETMSLLIEAKVI